MDVWFRYVRWTSMVVLNGCNLYSFNIFKYIVITIYAEICWYKNFLFQYIDKQMIIKKRRKKEEEDKDKRMIETKLITLIWMKNDETNMVMWVLIWKWYFSCDMKQIYWRMLGICMYIIGNIQDEIYMVWNMYTFHLVLDFKKHCKNMHLKNERKKNVNIHTNLNERIGTKIMNIYIC